MDTKFSFEKARENAETLKIQRDLKNLIDTAKSDGFKEGKEEGREEGRTEAISKMVINCYKNNMPISVIASLLTISEERVQEIIAKCKE